MTGEDTVKKKILQKVEKNRTIGQIVNYIKSQVGEEKECCADCCCCDHCGSDE